MSDEKKKMGRPKIDLEEISINGWETLDTMAAWYDGEIIAEKLGISYDTLCRRIKTKLGLTFAEYKKKKWEENKGKLRATQFKLAEEGSVPMLIWLGKNLLEQSDKVKTENEHNINKTFEDNLKDWKQTKEIE